MFKEAPKPRHSGEAANEILYPKDVLDKVSTEQLQERKKALTWLTDPANGQNAEQRAHYQAELDRITSILEQ
jgi:hypothetical protein